MKYLVNILFVALFIVTVGCNNELIGPSEGINPITDSEISLSAPTYQQASLEQDGTFGASNSLNSNKEVVNTPVTGDVTLTSGGGDSQENPEPPGGNN